MVVILESEVSKVEVKVLVSICRLTSVKFEFENVKICDPPPGAGTECVRGFKGWL